jgi:outer membrane protein assembly factor BamB/tetratricopeptide (TPR) repeat protein
VKQIFVFLSACCVCLAAAAGEPEGGLSARYFAGPNFNELKKTQTDPTVDFSDGRKLSAGVAAGGEPFSVRWSGQVKAEADEAHTFQVFSEGGVRLWVNDVLLVDNWRPDKREAAGTIKLSADRWYSLQLDYHGQGNGAAVRLSYSTKSLPVTIIPAANLRPRPGQAEPYPEPYPAPPDFLELAIERMESKDREEYAKKMDLSFEPTFFTLNDLSGYSKPEPRSTALVRAGLEKEQQGEYREALEIYQKVIEQHPDDLYRVSKYGIFVPVGQYCQRRILQFPAKDLTFYRGKHDARAKEAFEQAWTKNSVEGLAEIVEGMLATSYGGRATLALGDAALDRGHYLEALERYTTVCDIFPDKALHTPELDVKIALCRRKLGDGAAEPGGQAKAPSTLAPQQQTLLRRVLDQARQDVPPFHAQLASAPHVACDDYTLFPPSEDPLALREPVWKDTLPGSRKDFFVYTQPLATNNSVIYRHKNIVYCRSILTGELRWKNDLGGRVTWQNRDERQYPQEDVLVQDGLVFTPMHKVGSTLVALDETTGQLKWAYGPMAASTKEEAQMRFEAAPAGGPKTVYAGYVLDDIEGDTHTDTEYGVMAFESATGRVQWRRPVCRMRPGEFSTQFAEKRRNLIRSFTSPPLYAQGTVYYNTNAGAIAAIDALSGQVKWVMRYPYYALPYSVHDSTRQFGHILVEYNPPRQHMPMFWYNQRPLLVGERLYVPAVDSPYLFCIDRRTGGVLWTKRKGTKPWEEWRNRNELDEGEAAYVMGPIASGELVIVYRSRESGVTLVDPATGQTTWYSPDLLLRDDQPVMKYDIGVPTKAAIATNRRFFSTSARPLLTNDGRLVVGSHALINIDGYGLTFGYGYNCAVLDLNTREILDKRRYYTGEVAAVADMYINKVVPEGLKALKDLPYKDEKVRKQIAEMEEIVKDHVPQNQYGPFMPASRVTFQRYGVPFELRFGARTLEMVYDRGAVKKALAARDDPEGLFARAELALGESRLDEAAALMQKCLAGISSEDVDFRAAVNQQLYKVYRALAQSGIRAGRGPQELTSCLGMSQTVSTLADEMETLFALAEAYERTGDHATAGRMLQSAVGIYGQYEYPISAALGAGQQRLLTGAQEVMDNGRQFAHATLYGPQLDRGIELMRSGLPLYFSALSPLEKDLTVRAGDLGAAGLLRLQKASPEFAEKLEQGAKRQLGGIAPEEQLYRLWQFPGTKASQAVLDELLKKAAALKGPEGRRMFWRLVDVASVCRLTVPPGYQARVAPPGESEAAVPLGLPLAEREQPLRSDQEIAWLVLQRPDDRTTRPDMLFLGGRLKKRLDYFTFLLQCVDLVSGKTLWQGKQYWGDRWTEEIRLQGKGNEPGFFEAFVCREVVVVHGLYDVLAFGLEDGKLRWHYRVPFDFEIKHATASGDILVLAGQAETLAVYMPAEDPRGEVVWQQKEQGDVYLPPYFLGDRLVCVRKMPFSLTVRHRATGSLVGRLALADLSLNTKHPLFENGPPEVPAAHDGKLLALTDTWYYILVDVEQMKVVWKRLIDQSDPTRDPAIRFALGGDYLAVVKEDFDRKAIYMLSSRTGEVLWNTDPKKADSPQPLYSMIMEGGRVYGLQVHPGQGFYFAGLDCKTGKPLLKRTEEVGYQGKPMAKLLPRLFGTHAVALVRDGQDFEVKVFDIASGKRLHVTAAKGAGDWGEHGRVSATVQNGRLALLSKDKLKIAAKE